MDKRTTGNEERRRDGAGVRGGEGGGVVGRGVTMRCGVSGLKKNRARFISSRNCEKSHDHENHSAVPRPSLWSPPLHKLSYPVSWRCCRINP